MLNNANKPGPYGQFCTCVPVADDSLAALLAQVSCPRCVAYSEFSDRYKDEHGIRPRWAAEWSIARLEAAIADLVSNYEPAVYEPIIPTSGQGWALVAESSDLDHRLEADYYRG